MYPTCTQQLSNILITAWNVEPNEPWKSHVILLALEQNDDKGTWSNIDPHEFLKRVLYENDNHVLVCTQQWYSNILILA